MKNLGDRIVTLRKKKDIKQFQLANLIGISKMTLYKYENLISEPRASVIRNLADVLDTTSDYLLNRCDDPRSFDKGDFWFRLKKSEALLLMKIRALPAGYQQRIFDRVDTVLDILKKADGPGDSGR